MAMHAALDPRAGLPATAALSLAAIGDETRTLCTEETTVGALIDRLLEGGSCDDAVAVIAGVLPRPYAIAWACECFRAEGEDPSPADQAVLAAAERWLREPVEEHRAGAAELAERLGFEGAGAWLAAAAGWTGGSLVVSEHTSVPPGEHLTGEAVTAALRMLAARQPDAYQERLRQYAERALEVFGAREAPAGEVGT